MRCSGAGSDSGLELLGDAHRRSQARLHLEAHHDTDADCRRLGRHRLGDKITEKGIGNGISC